MKRELPKASRKQVVHPDVRAVGVVFVVGLVEEKCYFRAVGRERRCGEKVVSKQIGEFYGSFQFSGPLCLEVCGYPPPMIGKTATVSPSLTGVALSSILKRLP